MWNSTEEAAKGRCRFEEIDETARDFSSLAIHFAYITPDHVTASSDLANFGSSLQTST